MIYGQKRALCHRNVKSVQFGILRSAVLVFGMSVCIFPACAYIETVERIEDKPIRTYVKTSDPKGKTQYIANCKNRPATKLTCSVETEDRCDQATIEVVDMTVYVEKSTSTLSKVLEWASAGFLVGAGVTVTVDAGYLPDEEDPLDSNPAGKTGAYLIGSGLLAAGAGLLILAIVDSSRGIDDENQEGEVEIVKSQDDAACARRAFAMKRIELRADSGTKSVDTDNNGTFVAEQQNLRWAFTLSNAGAYYFEDRCKLEHLDQIDWGAVHATNWRDHKEGKQAEFLLEGQFPWQLVSRIGVQSRPVFDQILKALNDAVHRPKVEIISNWYC